MRKLSWAKIAELFLVNCIAVLLSAFAIWASFHFLSYQKDHANQRQEYAALQAANATKVDESYFATISPRWLLEWLLQLEKSEVTNKNIEEPNYDLQAQQDMAEWALGVLFVSILSFFAGILGICYVGLTLSATRKMASDAERFGRIQLEKSESAVAAANAANQIMREESRAWIKIELGPSITEVSDGVIKISIPFHPKNVGAKPAYSVSVKMEEVNFTNIKPELYKRIAQRFFADSSSFIQLNGVVFPGEHGIGAVPEIAYGADVESHQTFLMIGVIYGTSLGGTEKMTCSTVQINATRKDWNDRSSEITHESQIRVSIHRQILDLAT